MIWTYNTSHDLNPISLIPITSLLYYTIGTDSMHAWPIVFLAETWETKVDRKGELVFRFIWILFYFNGFCIYFYLIFEYILSDFIFISVFFIQVYFALFLFIIYPYLYKYLLFFVFIFILGKLIIPTTDMRPIGEVYVVP